VTVAKKRELVWIETPVFLRMGLQSLFLEKSNSKGGSDQQITFTGNSRRLPASPMRAYSQTHRCSLE
jgi:hypothetical protein